MKPTQKLVDPDATRRLETAVEQMIEAQRGLADLGDQRRVVAASTLAIFGMLSVFTVSFAGLGPAAGLALTTMFAVAFAARAAMLADIDADVTRRAEKVDAQMHEVELGLIEADRALDALAAPEPEEPCS